MVRGERWRQYWKQVVPMREWALRGWGEKNHGGPWSHAKDTKFKLWVIHHQTRAGPQRPLGPAVPLLGILQQPCLTHISKGGAQSSRTLFVLALLGQPKCPLGNWISKLIQHTMEYYAAVKKNKAALSPAMKSSTTYTVG